MSNIQPIRFDKPVTSPGVYISPKSVTVVTKDGEEHVYPLPDVAEAIVVLMEWYKLRQPPSE